MGKKLIKNNKTEQKKEKYTIPGSSGEERWKRKDLGKMEDWRLERKRTRKLKKKCAAQQQATFEICTCSCSCLKLRNTHSSHILHYKVIKCTLYIK